MQQFCTKVHRALEKDPKVDISTVLPNNYPLRLVSRKIAKGYYCITILLSVTKRLNIEQKVAAATLLETISQCQLQIVLPSQPAKIIYLLSAVDKAVFNLPGNTSAILDPRTTNSLAQLLKSSEMLWQAELSLDYYVVKCNAGIIEKCIDNNANFTEYTSMQYLEIHKPQKPALRPHVRTWLTSSCL